jgi:RNA polymerase sigma-70 factor (ECF subfamily)
MKSDLIALLPRLRRYARVLTGTLHQADKLVLDTLACAKERQDLRQQGTSLRSRLLTIMRGLYVDPSSHPWRRLAGTRLNVDEDAGDRWKIPAAGTRSGHGGGRTELTETLGHFSRLPVEQREVLVLVAVEGLPYDEIATLLGVPVATVMARLTCARKSMHSLASESPSREIAAK